MHISESISRSLISAHLLYNFFFYKCFMRQLFGLPLCLKQTPIIEHLVFDKNKNSFSVIRVICIVLVKPYLKIIRHITF